MTSSPLERLAVMAWAETLRQMPRQYRHENTTRRPPLEIACDSCGKKYLEHQSRIEKRSKHYCSRECRYEAMRGQKHSEETRRRQSAAQIGERASNWKGGRSVKYKRGYRSEQFKHWRTAVFEKDGYCCQRCGTSRNLTAHHVKPWRDYPNLRYEPSNGQTLCQGCHSAVDPHFHRFMPAKQKGGQ